MLEIVDEAEVAPAGEKIGHGVALVVADLEGEQAVGFECGVGLRDEAAVDVEAGWAGVQRGFGLVVADLGMQGFAVGGGDVGRVGDDGVPSHFLRGDSFKAVHQIGLDEADAGGEVVARGVGGGDFEGGG